MKRLSVSKGIIRTCRWRGNTPGSGTRGRDGAEDFREYRTPIRSDHRRSISPGRPTRRLIAVISSWQSRGDCSDPSKAWLDGRPHVRFVNGILLRRRQFHLSVADSEPQVNDSYSRKHHGRQPAPQKQDQQKDCAKSEKKSTGKDEGKKPSRLRCRYHDLRHAAITRLLEAGIPYPVVAHMMGWSAAAAIRMAKRYGHIGNQALRDVADVLGAVKLPKIPRRYLKKDPRSQEVRSRTVQKCKKINGSSGRTRIDLKT